MPANILRLVLGIVVTIAIAGLLFFTIAARPPDVSQSISTIQTDVKSLADTIRAQNDATSKSVQDLAAQVKSVADKPASSFDTQAIATAVGNAVGDKFNELKTEINGKLDSIQTAVNSSGNSRDDSTGNGDDRNTGITAGVGTDGNIDSTFICEAVNDYQLQDLPEVATNGSFIHVEYYWNRRPERETIIPAHEYVGGRFLLTRALKGHVWEYPKDCTYEDVKVQVDAHIQRRLAGNANNAGYIDWEKEGLFKPTGEKVTS